MFKQIEKKTRKRQERKTKRQYNILLSAFYTCALDKRYINIRFLNDSEHIN